MFNKKIENDSNGIDDDEVDDVHSYDENGDSENDDIAALECDITEGEVYEAIRILKKWKGSRIRPDHWRMFQKFCYTCCPFFSPIL